MKGAPRRRLWRGLALGRPGRRFRDHYRRVRSTRGALANAAAMLGGALLVALGVLALPTPIPGALLIFAGAAILASRSRRAAAALDWIELRARGARRKPPAKRTASG